MNLHIDDPEGLCADIDLNETWIDGLVELAETRDQANRSYLGVRRDCEMCEISDKWAQCGCEILHTLLDVSEGIGARAARDHATETYD